MVVVGDGGDDVGSKWTVEKKEEINGAIMGSVVDVGGVARSPTRASTFGLETLSHRNITSLLQHEIQWASHIMINLLLWKFSTETSPVTYGHIYAWSQHTVNLRRSFFIWAT